MRIIKFGPMVLLIILGASGCAMPVYEDVPYRLGSHQTPYEQAVAYCEPKAELAGANADNRARAQSALSDDGSCVGAQCVANSLGSGYAAFSAGERVRVAAFKSCMVDYGWGFRSECVSGCD